MIELLVVIFVIALLISILAPSLKRSMDVARATACKHNLREVGTGLTMYRLENDGWLPAPSATLARQSVTADAGGIQSDAWFAKLYPTYLNDMGVLQCPKDPYASLVPTSALNALNPDFASYGMNDFLLTAGGGYLANVDRHQPKRPTDTILAGDLGPDVESPTDTRRVSTGPTRSGSLMNWADGFDPFNDTYPPSWLTKRHGTGIHMLTLSNAVRDVRTVELMRTPIKVYYPGCAAGGCTFCNELLTPHYSFAKDRLYWWTGPIPTE